MPIHAGPADVGRAHGRLGGRVPTFLPGRDRLCPRGRQRAHRGDPAQTLASRRSATRRCMTRSPACPTAPCLSTGSPWPSFRPRAHRDDRGGAVHRPRQLQADQRQRSATAPATRSCGRVATRMDRGRCAPATPSLASVETSSSSSAPDLEQSAEDARIVAEPDHPASLNTPLRIGEIDHPRERQHRHRHRHRTPTATPRISSARLTPPCTGPRNAGATATRPTTRRCVPRR